MLAELRKQLNLSNGGRVYIVKNKNKAKKTATMARLIYESKNKSKNVVLNKNRDAFIVCHPCTLKNLRESSSSKMIILHELGHFGSPFFLFPVDEFMATTRGFFKYRYLFPELGFIDYLLFAFSIGQIFYYFSKFRVKTYSCRKIVKEIKVEK